MQIRTDLPPALNTTRAEHLNKMKAVKDSKTYKFLRLRKKEAECRFHAKNNEHDAWVGIDNV